MSLCVVINLGMKVEGKTKYLYNENAFIKHYYARGSGKDRYNDDRSSITLRE